MNRIQLRDVTLIIEEIKPTINPIETFRLHIQFMLCNSDSYVSEEFDFKTTSISDMKILEEIINFYLIQYDNDFEYFKNIPSTNKNYNNMFDELKGIGIIACKNICSSKLSVWTCFDLIYYDDNGIKRSVIMKFYVKGE